MNLTQKIDIIREVADGGEIITEDDLVKLFSEKKNPVAYDGMEPSGRIHIAQGLLRAININKMIKAGCKFKILIADWFAFLNNKFNGDIDKIKLAGQYYIEMWKACGLDTDKVEFIWTSDVIKDPKYWELVMRIARLNSVSRIVRCSQIMGRSEKEIMHASQIFYPCMQAADIFYLGVDITQLGMDQRKVNVLAREIAEDLGKQKPVIVSHHMLMGLGQPKSGLTGVERAIELKMSKSKPDTAIFMDDSPKDVEMKIKKAYCPEKQAQENPILEYCKYIIFNKFDKMEIKRPEKFGGDLTISSYAELERIFVQGKLHPMDLKSAVAFYLNKMLEPARQYFEKNKKAKEIMNKVKGFEITR